jgi:hypothetical protein
MSSLRARIRQGRWLGIALLVLWLAFGTYLLFSWASIGGVASGIQKYGSDNQASIEAVNRAGLSHVDVPNLGRDVGVELRLRALLFSAVALLGALAAGALILRWRMGTASTIVSWALYMWLWSRSMSGNSIPLDQSFQLRLQVASATNTLPSFLLDAVVMPVALSCAVLLILGGLFPRRYTLAQE